MFLDNLKAFGLTGQEATIYETLLRHGSMTGYEVSKETGISRSNVYSSLNGLVEKGAAFFCEGEVTRYTPENVEVFTENVLKELSKKAEQIKKEAPKEAKKPEGYITINGTKHIKAKIEEMLETCELRLYVMASESILREYDEILKRLVNEGKKIVILSDNYSLTNACVYKTAPEKGQIRLITDSSNVLTGTFENSEEDACLYSTEPNLVAVMKEALKNKIILIENNMEE